ncbi:MAG TPA: PEP-CTERM sorting domain-containing protein [Verrucomicrobiales bacterium]|nr:PEP-CTERM sorting domain-containing protein [Verrucomicrobiales bacterium]
MRNSSSWKNGAFALWAGMVLAAISNGGAVPVSLDNSSPGYSQNFNTLATNGTSSTLPVGWVVSESGTNADTTYAAGTGSSASGNTYSFGAGAVHERALGGLQSSSLSPTFGVEFRNDGTTSITSLTISYTGEQWRLGAVGRVDQLDFQYSLDANSLTTGVWIDVDALDFVAPVTSSPTGALDGNALANRVAISSTISSLSIPALSGFWLRWTDLNASGADDGLAVDDFSLTATFARPVTLDPPQGVPDAGSSLALLGFSLGLLGAGLRRVCR